MIGKGILGSFILISLMCAASIYGWMALPGGAQFPVHWDVNGSINRYANKQETLFAMPILGVIMAILFAVVPMIDPRRRNLEKSSALYLTGWLGGLGILMLAHGVIIFSALTGGVPSFQWILVFNGLFLILLGNFIAKSRSNWFAGIRTPWTLSSEHAWAVANRLAGWGFVITGTVVLVGVFFLDAEKLIMAMVGGLLASIFISMLVSYFAWRSDPDRITITK